MFLGTIKTVRTTLSLLPQIGLKFFRTNLEFYKNWCRLTASQSSIHLLKIKISMTIDGISILDKFDIST